MGARGELRCLFGGADWLCGRWLAPGKSAWHDSLNSPRCCGRGDKQCLSRLVLLFFVCRQGAKKELELWQAEHPGQLEEDVGSRHYADKLQASRFSRRAGFMVWYGMVCVALNRCSTGVRGSWSSADEQQASRECSLRLPCRWRCFCGAIPLAAVAQLAPSI